MKFGEYKRIKSNLDRQKDNVVLFLSEALEFIYPRKVNSPPIFQFPLFQFSDHEACQVTICEAQDNFYFYSLSKSYTFPGNIVRVTMPVNLTRSVPDVCFANLGNYGLYESCLPISSYLSYYNIVTSREKVKSKKKIVLELYRDRH